jgi:hypothetical protein
VLGQWAMHLYHQTFGRNKLKICVIISDIRFKLCLLLFLELLCFSLIPCSTDYFYYVVSNAARCSNYFYDDK